MTLEPAAQSARPLFKDVDIDSLKFDVMNPRFVEHSFKSEEDIVRHLYDEADVNELIQSILSAGYVDYEPLVVLDEELIVLEGNRRLAAIRLIGDENLRRKLRVNLPLIEMPSELPQAVRALIVKNREDARAFIGFKHINGPFKWDALAKAQYAAQWLGDGGDIGTISRTLGDSHNTVRRLVNGWLTLEQAKGEGFDLSDISKKNFSFSHLYTALSRSSVREFLELGETSAPPSFEGTPVRKERTGELLELMSWLYGQESKGQPTVIQSQNPNLNQLTRVLENEQATATLRTTRKLLLAFEGVEAPTVRFEDALVRTAQYCEEALKLSGHYEGNVSQLKTAENVEKTLRTLLVVMRSTAKDSLGSPASSVQTES